jgi:hypothetical protein
MGQHPLALPLAALMAWTMVMFIWMYATRLPAMRRAGIDVMKLRGGTGRQLDTVLPPEVQWKGIITTTCWSSRCCSMPLACS